MKKFIYILSLLLFVFSLSFQANAGMFKVSEKQEITLGAQAAQEVAKTENLVNNPELIAYVNKLGQKLASASFRPNITYYFFIVDTKDINAFALPGGFVFVNRGLIESADNESELVGVLAHEIGHIERKHGVKQLEKVQKAKIGLTATNIALSTAGVRGGNMIMNGASLMTQGVFLKYSRDMEREADQVAAMTMMAKGWNPGGMLTFFNKLSKMSGTRQASFLSTHPTPEERQSNIWNLAHTWMEDKTLTVNTEEFQKIKALSLSLPVPKAKK